MDGVRRVLYRLPELIRVPNAERVFIVEGEKDADRMHQEGLFATTNSGGAGNWQESYTQYFQNRQVVIIPDNDEPGRRHARVVARAISKVADSVKILELPGLPEKGDVSDFLDSGHRYWEISILADDAKEWEPSSSECGTQRKEADLVFFSDIQSKPVDFLVENRIPLGMLTLLAGDPGIGKSYLSLFIASAVSRGACWPDGTVCRKGKVILLSAEDPSEYVIKPRLDLLEADSREIMTYEAVKHPNGEGGVELANFSIVNDLDLIEKTLNEYGDIKLVIIDPLSAYFGSTDTHKDAAVRSVLTPLVKMSERHGVALVCVMHLNKSNSGKAVYRTMGSLAFPAAARTVWLVSNDPADPQSLRRFLLPVKHNVLKDPTSMSFELKDGRVVFDGKPVTITADDCLGAKAEEKATEKQRAIEFLKKVLVGGEPVASKQIEQMAKDAGIKEMTLKNAKRELGVKAKVEFNEDGERYWSCSLPVGKPKGLPTAEEVNRRLKELMERKRGP
jgi:archaellum biogenesis ATPase FlaH